MPRSNRLFHYWLTLTTLIAVLLSSQVLQPPCALAQAGSASVSGRVTDQTNAVMPDVEVEIKNVDTGVSQITKTNGDGFYNFPDLNPGNYLMSVRKQSFQTVSVTGITLNVQDNLSRNFVLQVGSSAVSVTVTADKLNVNTTDAAVSTVIDRQFVQNLPLNGRSFNTLLQLTPGVVIAPINPRGIAGLGQFSVAGQRTDANNFTVDGVSANFGTSPASALGQSGLGAFQALSAVGGTSSLVSVDALQEFRIETSSFSPEFGKTPGGQVLLTTRAGTNQLHGGIFEYFRNDVLDANDWFANQAGIPRAPERHNDFGGFLGGPILKDKTFFFFSYEGARLRLPQSFLITVPSVSARSSAPAALAPFLEAYPLPNGPVSPDGDSAQFTGVWSNRATLNATSLRIDHSFTQRLSVFARYDYAPSQFVTRTASLSSVRTALSNVQTGTVGVDMSWSKISNTIRANYSTQGAGTIETLDAFDGAVPPRPSLLLANLSPDANLAFFSNSDTGTLFDGTNARNRTKQYNIIDTIAYSIGSHSLKFGGDYRVIDLIANLNQNQLSYFAGTVAQFLATGTSRLTVTTSNDARIRAQSFSLFAQDSWKISPRLTATYGLRWELSPAPSALDGTTLAAWTNTDNPSQTAVAPAGSSLWNTTYGNVAPRVGIAYRLTQSGDFVLRAGGGIFYDLGTGIASSVANAWPNRESKSNSNVSLPVSSTTPYTPPPGNLQPPYGTTPGQTIYAFSSGLKLPRSYQWNVALEKAFIGQQALSATYIGQVGSDLFRSEIQVQPNANFAPRSIFQLTNNSSNSNYQALQLQYRKPLASGLQVLLNYSWSHSLDNASNDNVAVFSNIIVPLSEKNDRANSDFDVRHSFSGAVTYELPYVNHYRTLKYVTQGWSLDSVIVARSGFPFNATLLFSSPGPFAVVLTRPDLVPGQPLWIAQPTAPGGKILNSIIDPNTGAITGGAFAVPSTPRQGNEGRNDIPGFGLAQVDLSIGRKFSITERLKLQFRADAFNVFNHPNFSNPSGTLDVGDPTQLQATTMLNHGSAGLGGVGGLNPLFQEGGPRSLQLSLKLTF